CKLQLDGLDMYAWLVAPMDIAVIPKESLARILRSPQGGLPREVFPRTKQEVKVALIPEESCQWATGRLATASGSGSIVRQMYVDALALEWRRTMATGIGS
ncbi:hypothetical protein FOZ62_027469, partial [Perkinsus olseni]